MRCKIILLSLFIFASALNAQPPLPTEDPSSDDPGEAIQLFVAALNRNDIATAAKHVEGGQKAAALEDVKIEIQNARGTYTYQVRDVDLNFEGALQDTVLAKIRLRLQDNLNNKITHDERLKLHRVGTKWRIMPLSTEELSRLVYDNGESDILQNLATYLAWPRALNEIRTQKCMSHLKQLALGALQFVFDRDHKLAFNNDNFAQKLWPYTKNEHILSCPLDDQSYAFNAKLENAVLDKIKEPSLTVMFYEGQDGKLNFHHDNRAGVCFADGHVELVTPERAKTLVWNP